MASSLKIRPGTVTDASRINVIREKSFAGSLMAQALFPNGISERGSAKALQGILRDFENEHVIHMVVEDITTSEVVSCSKWTVHKQERPESEWNIPRVRHLLEDGNQELLDELLGQMHEARLKHLHGQPHMVLERLETDPEYQRKGAASLILDWGTAYADEAELMSYLESSQVGYPLYCKYGFRDVGSIVIDLTGFGKEGQNTNVCMIRQAAQKSSPPP